MITTAQNLWWKGQYYPQR